MCNGFLLQEVNLPFPEESALAAMTATVMEPFPASQSRSF
jgi:hypothetical protein